MSNVYLENGCFISGRHRPRKRHVDPADPSIERARCLDCGYPLLRSLVSRRWVISTYLGGTPAATSALGGTSETRSQ